MPTTDFGLQKIGSFLQGGSVAIPTYISFGTGSAAFDATKNYLNREVEASIITKGWLGSDVQYSAVLSTVQANGSSIGEIGIGIGSLNGSTVWARELSAIGAKDNTYSATIYITFKVTRG